MSTVQRTFKQEARDILNAVQQPPKSDVELRKALLKSFIGDFANWDLAANRYSTLTVSRELVKGGAW